MRFTAAALASAFVLFPLAATAAPVGTSTATFAQTPAASTAPRRVSERVAVKQTERRSPRKGKSAGQPKKPTIPPRDTFTADEDEMAVIPDIPNARFWADSAEAFTQALPTVRGPWLALSTGGGDGAFGAGLLSGLSASGKRPDFALISGVSTGALMAPFIFAGSKYDDRLRDAYTTISAGDVFELGGKGESFFDTWPLKELIAKRVTAELLADVAAEHRRGRRLFVITTNLDAERVIAWNMGAIAAAGGDAALKLFRDVLLAATSIPGGFPPVLIEVEANGRRFQEMHADGGLIAQFFVAPESLLSSTSDYRLPASELYIVINTSLKPDFQVTERTLISIIGRSVVIGVKTLTRLMMDRAYIAAKRSGIGFAVATIPSDFDVPSRGAFDPEYMKALYDVGFDQGKSPNPFSHEPPDISKRQISVPR